MVAKAIRPFSERVIPAKCVPVELPTGLRERISMILEEFNFAIEIPARPSDSWILEVTDVSTEVTAELEQLYGVEQLLAFDDNGDPVSVELEDFVKRTKPAQILDVLELFYHCSEDGNKLDFQRTLNDVLQEYKSDWRMKDGRFSGNTAHVPSRPITAPSNELLEGESRLVAALDQFHEAQNDLESGDYKAAMDHTCSSLESVLKSFFRSGRSEAGSLMGSLDSYGASSNSAESVGRTFGEQVLKSLSFLRDTLDRGAPSGKMINMSKVYAELAIHLSGSFILFATNLIIQERPTGEASASKRVKRLQVVSEAS
ncbi:MAG: hypothetical protein IH790_05265 [Acidobacteria bacterium]|nr:hypothetical protein [Acidobacteriota bacterium]